MAKPKAKTEIVEKERIQRWAVYDGEHQCVNVSKIQVTIKVEIPRRIVIIDQSNGQFEMGADVTSIDVGNRQWRLRGAKQGASRADAREHRR